jgi:hypothetical protein
MRFLDPQGRLCGKLSLLDAGAGIALGTAGLLLYLFLAHPDFLQRFSRTLHDEPPREVVLIEFLPDLPILMDLVRVGDSQRTPAGRVAAEVLGKRLRASAGLGLDTARLPGEVWVLTLRLRSVRRRMDGALDFGPYQIKPGRTFRFEPPRYSLGGVLLSVVSEGPDVRPDGLAPGK